MLSLKQAVANTPCFVLWHRYAVVYRPIVLKLRDMLLYLAPCISLPSNRLLE